MVGLNPFMVSVRLFRRPRPTILLSVKISVSVTVIVFLATFMLPLRRNYE